MTKIIRRKPIGDEPEMSVRCRVALDKRKPHWPKVSDDVASTTTMYEAEGIRLVGMVTDIDGLAIGWDVCACGGHISKCKHPITAPNGIVYVYRQRKGIVYEPGPIRGPYIGLRHNPDGSVAPLVVDSPTARLAATTDDPDDDPEPVRRVLRPRKPATDKSPIKLVRRKPHG